MRTPWLLTPGLYVVGENDDGDELVLSGPWFTDEEAEADRRSWNDPDLSIAVVGWLRCATSDVTNWEFPEAARIEP